MKRILMLVGMALAVIWSVNIFAAPAHPGQIGVVNMQQIFHDSPQVKKINAALTRQFEGRRNNIVKLGKQLQSDMQNYQKNKAVMSAENLANLKNKITKEETNLRRQQMQFQQDLFSAQNKKMEKFMNQVRGIVKTIAAKKQLTMVLPKNSVLYADTGMDITTEVLSKLQ